MKLIGLSKFIYINLIAKCGQTPNAYTHTHTHTIIQYNSTLHNATLHTNFLLQDRKSQAVKTQSDLLMMGVKTPETCLRDY